MRWLEKHYRERLLDPNNTRIGTETIRWLFHKYVLRIRRDGRKIFRCDWIETIDRRQYWVFREETYSSRGELTSTRRGKYSVNL